MKETYSNDRILIGWDLNRNIRRGSRCLRWYIGHGYGDENETGTR